MGKRKRTRSRRARHPRWTELSDRELLDVRLCDLGLDLRGTALAGRLQRLNAELERAALRFRPYTWLSTGWFTPDGMTGFAVPFFLAHPRLARLERRQMFEVEGGGHDWCMKLLRHETAHALCNAYGLHRRKRWREHFGHAGQPYRSSYIPNPHSRRYVLNLDNWYAQSHPMEDFAETFAVWLQPRSGWTKRYAGWPALKKLRYVDELMKGISDFPPRVRTRERPDSLARLRSSLREYYRRKRSRYGEEDRSVYDHDLLRLFSNDTYYARWRLAASFLRTHRAALRRQVADWTGQYQFVIDQVLRDLMIRAQDLRLRLAYREKDTLDGAAIVLTVHSTRRMHMRRREYFR